MNNDFKVIDDTLYSGVAAEDIIQRRKSPVIALIVALAGSALAVWSLTSDTMVDGGNLSSMRRVHQGRGDVQLRGACL